MDNADNLSSTITPSPTTPTVLWQYQEWKVVVRSYTLTTPGFWHQLHVSWQPALGLTVWAGLQMLASSVHPTTVIAPVQREHHFDDVSHNLSDSSVGWLTVGSVDSDPSAHIQVSGISLADTFVTHLFTGDFDGKLLFKLK
jgi:hypothetical protein